MDPNDVMNPGHPVWQQIFLNDSHRVGPPPVSMSPEQVLCFAAALLFLAVCFALREALDGVLRRLFDKKRKD